VEGGDGLASVAETLAGLTAAARAGGLDDTAALTALAAARRIAAELEDSELALIEAARDGGATWTRIAAALGARNRQTAQKRHADLARRCPRPPSVDTPAAQPGPQAPDARHDGSSLPEAKALVSEGVLPKSTIQADDHARLPPAPARPATARMRPAIPRITDAIIAVGLYELVRAPDHAETRAWHILVGGSLAGLVRPAPPGAGAQPPRLGASRYRRNRPARHRDRQDHPRRERPHPRCRRSQPAARHSAPAGARAQKGRPLNTRPPFPPRAMYTNRGHPGCPAPASTPRPGPHRPGSRRTQGPVRPMQDEHPSVHYPDPSVQLNSGERLGKGPGSRNINTGPRQAAHPATARLR